ncbi:MAG: L-lactate permease [Anaerolineales bacterium]|nr:L-lactate permease [Anaerolineales bacterium]
MKTLSILLALLPILIILLLLVWRRTPADISGVIGWICALLVAWLYFDTPLQNTLLISLSGVVASLPITIMVATSLLQITIMKETGAIDRVVAYIKTIAPGNKVAQILILNIGIGTLLAALGATPVSILPPIMIALGYSSFVAIALPSLGYDALCTYALLGIPVVVFANFVGLPVQEVGGYFARFMPVISTCIALAMLWLAGGWSLLWRGFFPTLLAGLTAGFIAIGMNALGLVTLTGIAAGLGVVLVMLAYLKLTGQTLQDRTQLTESDLALEKKVSLPASISPWIILTGFALLVNAPFLPFFELVFNRLSMPIEIIPGSPEKLRIFWQAYFWILFSTLIALPILKVNRTILKNSLAKWIKRAPRPMLASAIFFAIAYLINHSGKNAAWELLDPANNMVFVIADGASRLFGRFYPAVSPFLGLLSGFISGSETSAIAMLTGIHLSTAEKIGSAGLLIAAASGIGGGLASVISPAKLQNAAASIDKIGEESQVIRVTFVISLVITAVAALLTMFWA